ncbi:MAG: vWA domain-containing protein, partial [Myxococcales bacterium]
MRRVVLSSLILSLAFASTAAAAPCPAELPVLFLVQDKSGSMNQQPNPSACPTCPTMWESSKTAVNGLTQQFSNRFRFGLELYPRDSTTFNCTTGTIVTGVGATPAQIMSAYNAVAPGGGTPTAVSLDAARTYLKGLGLQTPAYVLLITDGLPNCNLALNPNTCQASTPGCANNSCGLGAKDCIDDAESRRAARDLLIAGIKVYVVGFGQHVVGANMAVLDGIAAAGGTGKAIAASDQAALTAALNQVAFDATTCCKDVCSRGASQCTSTGEVRRCELDPSIGCTNWTTTPCGNKSYCSNGSCVACTDACTLNAGRCVGSSAQKCVTGAYGCTEWKQVDECVWGEKCSAGVCNSCETCAVGATKCYGTQVETCTRDLVTGCTSFKRSPCQSGSVCSGGSCKACNTTCTAGAKRCNGARVETCVADTNGCTNWLGGQLCTDFCSGGECGTCGTTCTPGARRCNGSTPETCGRDVNGCTVWNAGAPCGSDSFCDNGTCASCPTDCNPGERRCAGNGIEECRVGATGCREWARTAECVDGETCQNGVCVPPCKDACSAGALRCGSRGGPEACEVAETGCTQWKAQAPCAGDQACLEGVCRLK